MVGAHQKARVALVMIAKVGVNSARSDLGHIKTLSASALPLVMLAAKDAWLGATAV